MLGKKKMRIENAPASRGQHTQTNFLSERVTPVEKNGSEKEKSDGEYDKVAGGKSRHENAKSPGIQLGVGWTKRSVVRQTMT